MNTGLLTNMLLTTSLDVIPNPSRPAEYGKNNQSSSQSKPNPVDNSPYDNTPEMTTTDNNIAIARNEPADKSPQDFRHALGEKISAETSQDNSANKKSESQDISSEAAGRQDTSQPELAQAVVTLGKAASITNKAKKTQTDQEVGQLLNNSKAGKSPSTNKETVKSMDDKLLLAIDKGQLKVKTACHDKSEDTPVADNQNTKGKTEVETQTTNITPNTTNSSTNNQSDKESMPETADIENKTVGTGQKQTTLNDNIIKNQELSTNRQKASVGLEKSAVTAIKNTDSKADTPQQDQNTTAIKNTDSKANTPQQDQNTSELLFGNDKGSNHTGKNPSGDTLLNSLNPTHVQTSTVKNSSNSADNNSSNSGSEQTQFEQMPSPNNAHSPTAEQISAFGSAGKTTNNTTPDNASANISQQIQEHISSSVRQGDQRVTIHLNPPELGKVSIKFQEQGEQITGLLEVSKTQTRYEIQQALPQIIRNLADSGIPIKRLEVVLADQTEPQTFKDQSLQDGSFKQQGSSEGDNFGNTATNSEWMTNINSYQDFSEQQDMFVTDKSINMLV